MMRIPLLVLGVFLVGCKFDQGERMEMADFLRRVAEEETERANAGEIIPEDFVPRDDIYRIGPGDVVDINIVGLQAPKVASSFQRRVRQDGKISLPVLEGGAKDTELTVEGLKPEEVEKAVTAKYSPTYIKDPQVTINVVNYKTTSVVVIGQVNNPGLINLKRDELNVLTAIARAGWIRDTSSGSVTLRQAKGGKETYQLWMAPDVSRALNHTIENGDVIEVDRRPADSAFVMGLVRNPSAVQLQPGTKMTFLGLLASVGGLDANFDPRDATLIRIAANGEPLRVRVDLNRIFNNTDPDFQIKPGDIVDVYHTDRTRAIEWFNKLVKVGTGVDLSYNPFYFGLNPFQNIRR